MKVVWFDLKEFCKIYKRNKKTEKKRGKERKINLPSNHLKEIRGANLAQLQKRPTTC
jgi:hypothetical protein